jgi:hypothetical protein
MVEHSVDLEHGILLNNAGILAQKSRSSDRVIKEAIGIDLQPRNLKRGTGRTGLP